MKETKYTARLPTLDVEITKRTAPEEGLETISIHLKASPSFDAVGRWLAEPGLMPLAFFGAGPLGLWAEMMRPAWLPWLALAPGGARLLPPEQE
jgi:hypothetical protein